MTTELGFETLSGRSSRTYTVVVGLCCRQPWKYPRALEVRMLSRSCIENPSVKSHCLQSCVLVKLRLEQNSSRCVLKTIYWLDLHIYLTTCTRIKHLCKYLFEANCRLQLLIQDPSKSAKVKVLAVMVPTALLTMRQRPDGDS
jgi:hypothetical protein